ncbi:hypothetical protein B0H16DRAFT_1483977 [Mycena metata]|uniref:Uncharacterized protein n=1 Tax=Mycena metata TaxID=1033252 RepID=A0AAD7DVU6_9AGAR|nr:hypothetical protein B0H16DRAFT_1483977 [Mycena metata]
MKFFYCKVQPFQPDFGRHLSRSSSWGMRRSSLELGMIFHRLESRANATAHRLGALGRGFDSNAGYFPLATQAYLPRTAPRSRVDAMGPDWHCSYSLKLMFGPDKLGLSRAEATPSKQASTSEELTGHREEFEAAGGGGTQCIQLDLLVAAGLARSVRKGTLMRGGWDMLRRFRSSGGAVWGRLEERGRIAIGSWAMCGVGLLGNDVGVGSARRRRWREERRCVGRRRSEQAFSGPSEPDILGERLAANSEKTGMCSRLNI